MTWKVLAAVVLLALAVAVFVHHAVMDTQIRSIADVRACRVQGGTVAVRGEIVYALHNRFVVDDGTGKAELSTCPTWYKHIRLYEGDRVIVVGKVMSNPSFSRRCDLILSVYKVFVDGQTILVRQRPGKPPWLSQKSAP